MAEVKYKDYTVEESMIYDAAMTEIREGVRNGLSFREACSGIDVKDAGLKQFIEDDALKVIIAEMHYHNRIPLQQMADMLKLPLKSLNIANREMLEDVGVTAAEIYRQNNPDGLVGHA